VVVIGGPLVETMVFQCLSLEFTANLRIKRSIRIALSVVPFALLHHFAGIPTVVAAGFVGGFYFAFTYERWRTESLIAAVVMTFLLHSSFNLVGALSMILAPK
jgi:membrane protease YdiL (CAAX protease family)